MTKRSTKKNAAAAAPKLDVYERVTAAFIDALEQAQSPTEWPWVRAARDGAPMNVVSRKGYRGINRIFLGLAVASGASRYFASFNQWKDKGAMVRKGEKGHMVVYWGEVYVNAAGDRCSPQEDGARRIMFPRISFVFSASQVDGWEAPAAGSKEAQELEAAAGAGTVEEVEAFITATGAVVNEAGANAFYRPSTDEITMPTRDRFRDTKEATATEHYYSTLLHELVHWTGAAGRLDRGKGNRFGSAAYAMEELVAEIGSAFLAADLGISPAPRADNVAYVANWLEVLKNDKKAVLGASTASTKAADYLHAMQPKAAEIEEEDDQEEEEEATTYRRAA